MHACAGSNSACLLAAAIHSTRAIISCAPGSTFARYLSAVSQASMLCLQMTSTQLRERAETLTAEVDSLRAALSRVQSEGAATRSELSTALADLQATKAALAARDEELNRLRSKPASQSAPDHDGSSQASAELGNGAAAGASSISTKGSAFAGHSVPAPPQR